jgi:L-fuculose-phosphate aldolase
MSLRKELLDICHKVYEKEYVSAYDGNLSIRINNETILITPSGKNKGDLVEADFQVIDYRGNLLEGEGKVSTEAKLHLFAYKHRSEINSVVHCHPVYATAFATAGEGFTRAVFPEVALGLGKVPLCKYATPSTDELAESMLPYIEYAWVFLLENHGAVSLGKDISGAYFRMEKLEHAAKTLFLARQLGREKIIPLLKLKELYSIAEEVYGIKMDDRNRMDF